MKDMDRQNIENEINKYKQLLENTDYQALKHADGAITDDEYAKTKAQRQEWRSKINELQAELEKGDGGND